jgi:hypothetical protein
MQVVPAASNHTAQVKSLIEQRRRLSLSTFIGFLVPHENLNLLSKETADGSGTAGSEDFGLPHGLPTKAYSHVLFGGIP